MGPKYPLPTRQFLSIASKSGLAITLFISSIHCLANTSPTLRFDNLTEGEPVVVSWESQSLTPDAPYAHYEYYVEMSADAQNWTPIGDTIEGGFLSEQTIRREASFDPGSLDSIFVRVAYRLNMPETDLSGRDLREADLRGANLNGADLSGADLSGANLNRSQLENANLDNAVLLRATFPVSANNLSFGELEGEPDILASEALPNIRFKADLADYSLDGADIGGLGVPNKHAIVMLNDDASIGEVNTLLANFSAQLVASERAGPYFSYGLITCEFSTTKPDELLEVCEQVEALPFVSVCVPDFLVGSDAITDDRDAAFTVETIDKWFLPDINATYQWDWEAPPNEQRGNWGFKNARVTQMWNSLEALQKFGNPLPVDTVVIDGGFEEHIDLFIQELNLESPRGDPDHGMNVAGIISATHGNNIGVDGINPFASLHGYTHSSTSFIDVSLTGKLASQASNMIVDARDALRARPNARLINMSLGFNWNAPLTPSILEISVLGSSADRFGKIFKEIADKAPGTLFTVSAGNDGGAIDATINSPMSNAALVQGAPNIIVVESHEPDGSRSGFSNGGGHLSAPGSRILSLASENGYAGTSGTSQAAPFVAGVAGYLLAIDPSISPGEMKSLLTTEDRLIDAYRALLELDNRVGRDRDILRMLLDFDDGSEDGNLRLSVPEPVSGVYRSFKEIEGDVIENEDLDGDGGPGDGDFDMSDFRRWRDWLIHGERLTENTSQPHGLNGEPNHIKFDANRDGRVEIGKEADVYPRGDFNGDGFMDRSSTHIMYGHLDGETLSDLDVFVKSSLFDDDHVESSELKDLVDSVDVTVSFENILNSDLGIDFALVNAYDAGSGDKIGKARAFSADETEHIFTVPIGKTVYMKSDIISLNDDTSVVLRTPEDRSFTSDEVGGDFVVDLSPIEMTSRAYVDELNLESIVDEPEEAEVDAWIQGDAGIPDDVENSEGARATANEEGTLWSVVRTADPTSLSISLSDDFVYQPFSSISPNAGPEPTTFRSEVVWRRSFVKVPEYGNPEFEVKPLTLKIVDGLNTQDELRASAELKLELRKPGGDWEEIFYTKAEIAGYSQGIFGPDTFELVTQEGDIAGGPFELIESGVVGGSPEDPIIITFNIGASYEQEGLTDEVPIDDIPDGVAFEIRYTLNAIGQSLGPDTLAEAVIGDPLDYPSGVQMAYGPYGELTKIIAFSSSDEAGAAVSTRSRDGFVYVLIKMGSGSEEDEVVDLAFGIDGSIQLLDPNGTLSSLSSDYRIDMRPFQQAKDADGDGIDDAYELERSNFLDPLDPDDAGLDQDGDGFSNLAEYQNETDPEVPDESGADSQGLFPGKIVTVGNIEPVFPVEINQDGVPDFLGYQGTFQGSIVATLSNPDGSYQMPVETPFVSSTSANGFAPIDLNGDPYPDFLVGDVLDQNLTVFLGSNNGQFTQGSSYPLGDGPARVAVGDFNDDGDEDALVVTDSSKNIILLAGDGEGGLSEETSVSFDSTPTDVTVGDFNGDDIADLAASMVNAQAAVLFGAAQGSFDAPVFASSGFSPRRIASGDLNADGRDDLVVANGSSDSVSVLLATDGNSFEPKVDYAVGDTPNGISIATLDDNSSLDIIVSHSIADFHSRLLNDGSGDFGIPQNVYSNRDQTDANLVDWNEDGILDLISSLPTDRALVLLGDGSGGFESRQQIDIDDASTENVLLRDVFGDDSTELVILNQDSNTVEFWSLSSDGAPSELLSTIAAPGQVEDFAVGLLNGDEHLDVVAISAVPQFFGTGENRLSWYFGDGTGAFPTSDSIALDFPPRLLAIGQFDNQAGSDFAVTRPDDNETQENETGIVLYLNNGSGVFSEGDVLNPVMGVTTFLAQDLNGDNDDEIIASVTENFSPKLKVFGLDELNTWQVIQTIDLAGSSNQLLWLENGPGDRAGLGLLIGGSSGSVQFHPLGGGALQKGESLIGPIPASGLAFGNFDNDNTLDIGVSNGGYLSLFIGQLYNAYEADEDLYWLGPGKNRLIPTDLDGDSLLDIVSWNPRAESISVIRQNDEQ